jgi:hypothetical protein
MEEDNLEMGMFDNLELNFDGEIPSFEDLNDDDQNPNDLENDNKDINDVTEDDDPGEVSDEEDDSNEGSDDDEDASSSSTIYSSLATVLSEQGLLPSLDIENTKIESVEDFVEAFKKESEIQAELKLQEYIQNMDIEKVAQSKAKITEYSLIDETTLSDNIELAKQLIYQDYINQGIGEAKASRLLNRLIDLGDDAILEDATESLASLKEFEVKQIEAQKEQYKQSLIEQEKYQKEIDENLKKIIFDKKDLINGFNPTKAFREKVYKSINEVVGKSPEGQFENKFMRDRRANPLEFESRMYAFYELTNGFTDYSKLTTSAKSNAVKELEKAAKKTTIVDNGTPLWAQDSNSYDSNIGSILNI